MPGGREDNGACNLSIAMAEIGRKVLLIDGDLRRPRLYKVFGMENTWGLSDQVWADFPLDSVPISDLVRQTEVSGLSVLPGGSCGVPPANLFYSPRMPRLLRRFRREFDMIMIDAPPMIHLADACVLGRLADGVILVVRAGQTISESARFAILRFAEDGTRVLPMRILRQVSGNADLVGGPTLAPQSASETHSLCTILLAENY